MSDNIDQTIEYQEQILDDLDDIKGSLDEESEYYDKEYQKEVLQSLKGIQKSVKTLADNDLETIEYALYFTSTKMPRSSSGGTVYFSSLTRALNYYKYDISDFSNIHIKTSGYSNPNYVFVSNAEFDSSYNQASISGNYIGQYSYNADVNFENVDYNYLYYGATDINSNYPIVVEGARRSSSGGDDPLPDEPVEVVTTSSAVIIEGLDNLTQITTFQSFCSSLLIGILLFLVFVKGLRK